MWNIRLNDDKEKCVLWNCGENRGFEIGRNKDKSIKIAEEGRKRERRA